MNAVPGMLILILLLISGCGEETVPYPARYIPTGLGDDIGQISRGQQLFIHKCASCHGKTSEGRSERADFFTPAAPDFTEERYLKIDPAYLYWRIDLGKSIEPYRAQGSVMPAWGLHLSEQQIWQLVAYLQSRAH